MEGLDRDALDRYITSPRYSRSLGRVTCPCGEGVLVTAESEYGWTTWEPAECPRCGWEFEGDEHWEDDEGPDPDREYDMKREMELG